MNAHRLGRLRASAPHLLVVLWLAFAGASLWQHASASGQPPIWDPFTYILKAKNFWDCVAREGFCNPLDVPPTVRPPGTILMSYPLGFSDDFQAFHFRSVFLPLLCAALAPYIALGARRAFSWGWGTAATALLFSSLPMFFHLEWSHDAADTGAWGLVDGFISAVSALAAAALIRSVAASSLTWLLIGAMLGALTLFIKPSGAMVMGLLGLCWALLSLRAWRRARREGRGRRFLLGHLLPAGLLIGFVYAAAAWSGATSLYLSPDNFSFARKALATARQSYPIPPAAVIARSFHRSLGAAAAIWALAIVALTFSPAARTADRQAPAEVDRHGLLLAACTFLAGGVWYWLYVQVIVTQIRYLWPFLLAAMTLLVPLARHAWVSGGPRTRQGIGAVCCAPALLTAFLLAVPDPPRAWERAAGVNIAIGTSRRAEAASRAFLARHRGALSGATFFGLHTTIDGSVFEHALKYDELIRPHATPVTYKSAYDWVRGFVVRTSDLLSSDYLFFTPPESGGSEFMHTGTNDFLGEQDAFIAWLSGLSEGQGVRHLEKSPALHILRVVDHPRFETELQRFVESRSWRAEFETENPRRWWDAQRRPDLTGKAVVANLDFGGRYRVRAMSSRRSDAALTLEFLWEPLRPDADARTRLWFFHLLDAKSEIIAKESLAVYPFAPPDPSRPLRFERVTLELPAGKEAARLGFGIYSPGPAGAFLIASRKPRDWRGQRALIRLGPRRPRR